MGRLDRSSDLSVRRSKQITFIFPLFFSMKAQSPPKLYGDTVRPLLVDGNPNWSEKEISDAVQRNWDRAGNDVKMIYLQRIIQDTMSRVNYEISKQLTRILKNTILKTTIDPLLDESNEYDGLERFLID